MTAPRHGQLAGFVPSGPSRAADAVARSAGADPLTPRVVVGHARGVAFCECMGCRCEPSARPAFGVDGMPLQQDRQRLPIT